MSELNERSVREVFEDHLRLRARGELEADLERNYDPDVVLLCDFGVLHGRDAVRESAHRLGRQLDGGRYEYVARWAAGDYAFLRWRAESADTLLEHGADSFVIRNGVIVMQSVYYTVMKR